MITLFIRTGCPYCEKVRAVLEKHALMYETKNIANETVLKELIQEGGKQQVPFLVDGEARMYESGDIVAYIEDVYSTSGT